MKIEAKVPRKKKGEQFVDSRDRLGALSFKEAEEDQQVILSCLYRAITGVCADEPHIKQLWKAIVTAAKADIRIQEKRVKSHSKAKEAPHAH